MLARFSLNNVIKAVAFATALAAMGTMARAENADSRPLLPDQMTPGLASAPVAAAVPADNGRGPLVVTVNNNRSVSSATTAGAPPAGHDYYIDFRARHALTYGHSFVMFGRLDARGRQLSREVAGLHPATDDPRVYMAGHIIWVPSETGPSDGDLEDEYLAAKYRVHLTKDQYDRVVAHIRQLQARSTMWHAVFYNCSAFVGDIARFMGFSHPSSLEFPENFINNMKAMNGGRSVMQEQSGALAMFGGSPAEATR